MNILSHAEDTVPTSDRWSCTCVCDLEDPLRAEVEVEGNNFYHQIKITIWGDVPALDVAIDAAQDGLIAYVEAIAAHGRVS